jgi:hypothetical protein
MLPLIVAYSSTSTSCGCVIVCYRKETVLCAQQFVPDGVANKVNPEDHFHVALLDFFYVKTTSLIATGHALLAALLEGDELATESTDKSRLFTSAEEAWVYEMSGDAHAQEAQSTAQKGDNSLARGATVQERFMVLFDEHSYDLEIELMMVTELLEKQLPKATAPDNELATYIKDPVRRELLIFVKVDVSKWLEEANMMIGSPTLAKAGEEDASVKFMERSLFYGEIGAKWEALRNQDFDKRTTNPPWYYHKKDLDPTHEMSDELDDFLSMGRIIFGRQFLMRHMQPVIEHTAGDAVHKNAAMMAAATNGGLLINSANDTASNNGFLISTAQQEYLKKLPPLAKHCGKIDRLPYTVDAKTVFEKYIYPNRPFIIEKGAVDSWPAIKEWNRSTLIQKYGTMMVTVANQVLRGRLHTKRRTDGDPGVQEQEKVKMPLSEFIGKAMTFDVESSAATEKTLPPNVSFVFNTVMTKFDDDCPIPDIFEDLMENFNFRYSKTGAVLPLFKGGHADGLLEFSIGAALSGAQTHCHRAAWNVLVLGKKRWAITPPRNPFGQKSENNLPKVALDWFENELPTLQETCEVLEFEQLPGEIVYVPDEYEHATINLESAVAVAKQVGRIMWPFGLPTDFAESYSNNAY